MNRMGRVGKGHVAIHIVGVDEFLGLASRHLGTVKDSIVACIRLFGTSNQDTYNIVAALAYGKPSASPFDVYWVDFDSMSWARFNMTKSGVIR